MTKGSKKGIPTAIDIYVGARAKERREFLKITQETLAKKIGKTFQQIQKYENGTNRMSAGTLYEIAPVLKWEVQDFYEGYGGKDKENNIRFLHGLSEDDLSLWQAVSSIGDAEVRKIAVNAAITVIQTYNDMSVIMHKSARLIEDNKKTADVYQQIYEPLYNLSPEYVESAKGFINKALSSMQIHPESLAGMTVFNIGTGREAFVFERMGAKNVYHADISQHAVNSVQKFIQDNAWHGSMHTALCDACADALPWKNVKFDLAYLNGVVHHFHDPVSGIVNIAHSIADGGYFHVRLYRSGSFLFFVASILRQIIHESEKEYFHENEDLISQLCGITEDPRSYMDFYDDVFVPHQWLFDPDDLTALFQSIGFENKPTYHASSYSHDAARDSDEEGLYTMSFKKIGTVKNISGTKMTLQSVDQIDGIDYKEDFIKNSVRLFLLVKSDILKMNIEDRAELAASLYRLARIPTISQPPAQRHAELQRIIKEKVTRKL